ncbi:hypothetical protein M3Y94_01263400 [Aphelenchoides besseyi]|nr:hypothetical protein M3Y94_01263400 [Aphelenchoides besseyi]KAI6222566.1 hypothetical protein M3Y95_00907000 [Aphelenchoides besseyi]
MSELCLLANDNRPVKLEIDDTEPTGTIDVIIQKSQPFNFHSSNRRNSDQNFVQTAAVAQIPTIDSLSDQNKKSAPLSPINLQPTRTSGSPINRRTSKSNRSTFSSTTKSLLPKVVHCSSTFTVPIGTNQQQSNECERIGSILKTTFPLSEPLESTFIDLQNPDISSILAPYLLNIIGSEEAQIKTPTEQFPSYQRQSLPISQPPSRRPSKRHSTTTLETDRPLLRNRDNEQLPIKQMRLSSVENDVSAQSKAQNFTELQREVWRLNQKINKLESKSTSAQAIHQLLNEMRSEIRKINDTLTNLHSYVSHFFSSLVHTETSDKQERSSHHSKSTSPSHAQSTNFPCTESTLSIEQNS